MNIKFSCPHCKKPLKVKEELAGKKAKCPACQKVLVIPNPSAAPATVEELAAALADKPAAPPPPTQPVTIDFSCYYCEADLRLDVSLAGKQTPCPQCKRIIKVPVLVKNEPKDWRAADLKGAARAGAGQTPEGAWGSVTSVGSVSKSALIEAGAIPEERPPWTARKKLLVGTSVAALLSMIGCLAWLGPSVYSQWRQDRKIAQELEKVSSDGINPKISPCEDAKVHIAAGEYYRRSNRSDSAPLAEKHFGMARTLLRQAEPGKEHAALVIRLALAQIDLAGSTTEVDKGQRITWDQAQREAEQTMQLLLPLAAGGKKTDHQKPARAAYHEGLRAVGRRLIERNQPQRAKILPFRFGEPDSEALVVVAQEMVRGGHRDVAAQMAQNAITLCHSAEARSGGKAAAPSSALLALCKELDVEISDIRATGQKQDQVIEPGPGR